MMCREEAGQQLRRNWLITELVLKGHGGVMLPRCLTPANEDKRKLLVNVLEKLSTRNFVKGCSLLDPLDIAK